MIVEINDHLDLVEMTLHLVSNVSFTFSTVLDELAEPTKF